MFYDDYELKLATGSANNNEKWYVPNSENWEKEKNLENNTKSRQFGSR